MILLTSEDFVKSMTNISDNLQGSYLGPAIREAQDVDYQAIVGTSLYKKLQELVEEDTINDEANGKYKELLDNSQYFIAYSAIVKIILLASVKLDNFGASQATDENIKALSLEEVLKLQNIYQSKADFYAKRLQKYLCENEDFFPELGNSGDVKPNLYSAASTGLFLGGQRGRKMPKANGCGSCGTPAAGGGTYTLPVASETTLGGIKVGSGLSIDSSGRLSADGGSEETYHLDEMTNDELKDLYNYLSGKSESEISEIAFYYGGTRLTLDTKDSNYIRLTGIGSKLNSFLVNERLYRVSLSSSGISTTEFECAPQITIYCDYTSENKTLSIADSPINFASFGVAMSQGHRVNFNIILLSGSTPSYSGGSQTNLMSSCISCIYRPITQLQGYYYADFKVSGVVYEARWKMSSGIQTLNYWREKTYYTLPTASSETLGGIKVGSGLTIDSGGTLSAEGGVAQYDLDAMTQSERAEFVAMCENLTDGERRLLFVYRDGVICRYDHTEGSGDSFKIGFYSYREDGWDYPLTYFRHFFITADGSYEELGNGVYPNILTFDTTYSDTAHTLSSSDNLSPLIPIMGLGTSSEGKVAINLRLIIDNNRIVLSSKAWSERTGNIEGRIGAEWHYSGNVITAVWNVVEHNATIASWTEVPEGGSSAGGDYVVVDSLSDIENPEDGMIAFVSSHQVIYSGYSITTSIPYTTCKISQNTPMGQQYMFYIQGDRLRLSLPNYAGGYETVHIAGDGVLRSIYMDSLFVSYDSATTTTVILADSGYTFSIGVSQDYVEAITSAVTISGRTYIYRFGKWFLYEDGKASCYLSHISQTDYSELFSYVPKFYPGSFQFIIDVSRGVSLESLRFVGNNALDNNKIYAGNCFVSNMSNDINRLDGYALKLESSSWSFARTDMLSGLQIPIFVDFEYDSSTSGWTSNMQNYKYNVYRKSNGIILMYARVKQSGYSQNTSMWNPINIWRNTKDDFYYNFCYGFTFVDVSTNKTILVKFQFNDNTSTLLSMTQLD